jgi:hypothetical protein
MDCRETRVGGGAKLRTGVILPFTGRRTGGFGSYKQCHHFLEQCFLIDDTRTAGGTRRFRRGTLSDIKM